MKPYMFCRIFAVPFLLAALSYITNASERPESHWVLIDDFEQNDSPFWITADTQNDTDPLLPSPQITEIRTEETGNRYLIKKPAADGVVGNRKALTYRKLPPSINVGETYTIYTRFLVESFPNNHVFGLSNLSANGIEEQDYNALEPSLRVTDKYESDGTKNDGALMVRHDNTYSNVQNFSAQRSAKQLVPGTWYEVWWVVNNSPADLDGQIYDVYLRGGEFPDRTKVFENADFRMKREQPINYFMMNCNTGPARAPYGNGGLAYDDLYMAEGLNLDSPIK